MPVSKFLLQFFSHYFFFDGPSFVTAIVSVKCLSLGSTCSFGVGEIASDEVDVRHVFWRQGWGSGVGHPHQLGLGLLKKQGLTAKSPRLRHMARPVAVRTAAAASAVTASVWVGSFSYPILTIEKLFKILSQCYFGIRRRAFYYTKKSTVTATLYYPHNVFCPSYVFE